MRFVAIDFETADHGRDSACAIGLVRVDDGIITERVHRFIRPPRDEFVFTYIHGITWDDVAGEPAFGPVWSEIQPLLEGVDFLAAHNVPFDRGVLGACCASAGLPAPELRWRCTVQLSRRVLGIRPANLRHVCDTLGIPLRHHEALSDAEACARIVLEAQRAELAASRNSLGPGA
jgi:DNA polymerase-3 subunit epsilon